MEATPREVVEECFDRMGDPDRRETIGELFADDAMIAFPGAEFEGSEAPDELLTWLEPRYEWAAKSFDRWIVAGPHVVSLGTLYGVDRDGDEFEGVRYVDVYEVVDGQITRMDVYNDLAVEGIVPVDG